MVQKTLKGTFSRTGGRVQYLEKYTEENSKYKNRPQNIDIEIENVVDEHKKPSMEQSRKRYTRGEIGEACGGEDILVYLMKDLRESRL